MRRRDCIAIVVAIGMVITSDKPSGLGLGITGVEHIVAVVVDFTMEHCLAFRGSCRHFP